MQKKNGLRKAGDKKFYRPKIGCTFSIHVYRIYTRI